MILSVYELIIYFLGLASVAYLMTAGAARLCGAEVPPRLREFGSHLITAFFIWRAVGSSLSNELPSLREPPAARAHLSSPDDTI